MKFQKERIVLIGIAVFAFVIVSAFAIVRLCIDHSPKNAAFAISFPKSMDSTPTVSSETLKEYDAAKLQAMVDHDTAYLYYAPKLKGYSIVKKLNSNFSEYSVYDGMPIRLYLDNHRDADESLEIDPYGCFTYDSGAPDTYGKEYPFTDEQTLEMAKAFLNQYNLLDDSFSVYSISNTMIMQADSETVVARKVEFFQSMDGKEICGSNRMGVNLNGNGEVTDAYYYVRQYTKRKAVDLISVEEALKRIEKGEGFVKVSHSGRSDKLTFEKVSIGYWTHIFDYEHTVMQPVYIFEGTSLSPSGTVDKFTIMVQANILDKAEESAE